MIWFSFIFTCLGLASLDIIVKRNKAILFLIMCSAIILFIAMRLAAGVDWVVYQALYDGNGISVPFEVGYRYLSLIISLTGLGFWGFVFLITLFSFYSLNKFFKKSSPFPIFCLGIYFSISFAFNIEALRQIVAVAIILNALVLLFEGRILFFYVFVFIAACMHASASLLFILPIINNDTFKKYAITLFLIGIVLAVFNQFPVEWVINLLTQYFNNSYLDKIKLYSLEAGSANFLTVNFIFKIITLFFFISAKKQIYKNIISDNNKKVLDVIVSMFYLMLFIDIFLGKYGTIRIRLNEFLNPGFVCLISIVIKNIHVKVLRQIFCLYIFSYVLLSFSKFSLDPYFLEQFKYHNSLEYYWLNDKSVMENRKNEVSLYWQERDKVSIGN